MKTTMLVLPGIFVLLALLAWGAATLLTEQSGWTPANIKTLRSLWIGVLPAVPSDPSNKVADNAQAASLGYKLFFDTRFSANGKVACATCHSPAKAFQDGLPLAKGIGTTTRRTMSIIGTAYTPWLFWDGRKDSQWSQALGPMESAAEHGGNRVQYAHLIARYYRADYEAIFGPLPDLASLPDNAGPVADLQARAAWENLPPGQRDRVSRIYANIGKSIAAYERQLNPGPSRFDIYVQAVLNNEAVNRDTILSRDERAGLRLFIGKANCIQCHNGPLFSDNHFHNTGVPAVVGLPEDLGRLTGAIQVRSDEFNCLGRYSDADPSACAELKYMITSGDELLGAFRPPSLRGVADRPPTCTPGSSQRWQT